MTLEPDDEVALEATGNSDAIANLLTPIVARVVSNPSKTRAIAEAKIKTGQGGRADLGAAADCGFPAAGVAAG